jgi:hypothetical protein
MGYWHRMVAVLVALVFVTSSSLASMPLVWCVGADGHRAVEYKTGSRHTDHHALGQRELPAKIAAEPQSAEHDDCQDWHLVSKAKVSALQADQGLLTFDLRVAVALPALHIPTLPEIAQATLIRPPESAPSDPQRAALRSVVLLI